MKRYIFTTTDPFSGLTQNHLVFEDSHGTTRSFPLIEGSEIALEHSAWLAEGNTPEPWEAPHAD